MMLVRLYHMEVVWVTMGQYVPPCNNKMQIIC